MDFEQRKSTWTTHSVLPKSKRRKRERRRRRKGREERREGFWITGTRKIYA